MLLFKKNGGVEFGVTEPQISHKSMFVVRPGLEPSACACKLKILITGTRHILSIGKFWPGVYRFMN